VETVALICGEHPLAISIGRECSATRAHPPHPDKDVLEKLPEGNFMRFHPTAGHNNQYAETSQRHRLNGTD